MKKIITIYLILSTLIYANSNIKSLDIFKNKNFINQFLESGKKSANLLGIVKLEDIRFLIDPSCKVNSFDMEFINYKNDQLSKKIENLKNSINRKENTIKALKSEITFLEKSNISNLKDISFLEKTSTFIKKQILKDYTQIYNLEKQLKNLNGELKILNQKRANNKYTKLNYDINCKNGIIVNYPITNIKKRAFYDINYDSKNKNLELKNLLFITQSTGEDLKGIDINLYSYNYINQINPNRFIPKYIDINPKKEMNNLKVSNDMQAIMVKSARFSTPNYEYFEDNTKSFFKASNINLLSGKDTKVVFSKDNYKANDILEIDGYSQSQAFSKVDFKSKKLYGVNSANLYLDGTYIGKTFLSEIKKDKKRSIYFGTNRFIDIEKKLLKDLKEEPFFSINKIKTQKIWDYKITNNSKNLQNIVLLERVPISKHKDIKISLIGKTKESKLEKNGKIYFEFKLKPNETKKINFGYEIEKPNKN